VCFAGGNMLKTVQASFIGFLCLVSVQGSAFDGLVVSDLPVGGDVTVPSDYPIQIPPKMDVRLSGVADPQALVLANRTLSVSVVRVGSTSDKTTRTITLKPGASAVYNFKSQSAVRLRVVSGDVRISSLHPLKVQR
jgi:hypothetical protein